MIFYCYSSKRLQQRLCARGGTGLLKIMNSALGSITVTASGILKDYLFWSLDNFTDFKPQTREAIESDLEEAEE